MLRKEHEFVGLGLDPDGALRQFCGGFRGGLINCTHELKYVCK